MSSLVPPSGSPRRLWYALVLLFVISLPAVTTRLYASDEIQFFAYLRSLWFDHDLSFENEYRYFYDRNIATAHGFHETFLEMQSETGLRYNFGTMGSALLWAPFYGVADLGVRTFNAMGWSSVPADGFSRPYLAAVAYGSAVYGFLAVALSIAVTIRLLGRGRPGGLGPEALGGAALWVGSPLVFYMYLAPGMSHATSAFTVALFVMTWLLVRTRWSATGLIVLGALAALMTMVREQDAFFVVGPIVDFLWGVAGSPGRDRARLLGRGLLGGLAGIVCFAPQAVSYVVLNGRIGPADIVSGKMFWTAPHAWSVLWSPAHGLFFWTPLALAGVVGLVRLVAAPGRHAGEAVDPRDLRRVAGCLVLMVASQVYVSGSVASWTLAGSFGQRRFVGTTVILVVGLAAAISWVTSADAVLPRHAWRRLATAVVLTLGVWWNLGLMAQFGAGMMDRQRLELARNAYGTFVLLPRRVPELAYRFLFDRTSFYQTGAAPPQAP